jgi:hypothetical protein
MHALIDPQRMHFMSHEYLNHPLFLDGRLAPVIPTGAGVPGSS